MNKRSLSAALLAAVILLCGCQKIADDTAVTGEDTDSINDAVITVMGEESYPDGYPVIINDTEIKAPPEKVVCLSGGLTEMIYELGFGEKLTGRGSYCDSPEEAAALPDLGKPTAPDIDAIKAAAPSLVITATPVAGKDVIALADSGISVVYIPAPRSVEEFGRVYAALGMIFEGMFDGEDDGNKVYRAVKEKLDGCTADLGKFIYVTEGLTVAGGDTFESSVLSLYGTNIAQSSTGYSFDKTSLTEEQPDTVVLNSDISLDELRADGILGSLDAVTAGKVISVSNSYFESPSGSIIGICDELAAIGG